MYAIFKTSMTLGIRRMRDLGEFETIDAAVMRLRDDPARIRFWDRDEENDAADVLMGDGTIYAIQKPR